jgi:hypothetical protein
MGKSSAVWSASGIMAVTPSDVTILPAGVRALVCAVGGNIGVTMVDGSTGVIPAVPAGMPYPAQVTQVLSTGTTATGILVHF